MLKQNLKMNLVLDSLFSDYKCMMTNADFVITLYILFEIIKSGEDQMLFSSTEITKQIGFARQAQVKALDVAQYNNLIEVEVKRSKGNLISLGKNIKEMLNGSV